MEQPSSPTQASAADASRQLADDLELKPDVARIWRRERTKTRKKHERARSKGVSEHRAIASGSGFTRGLSLSLSTDRQTHRERERERERELPPPFPKRELPVQNSFPSCVQIRKLRSNSKGAVLSQWSSLDGVPEQRRLDRTSCDRKSIPTQSLKKKPNRAGRAARFAASVGKNLEEKKEMGKNSQARGGRVAQGGARERSLRGGLCGTRTLRSFVLFSEFWGRSGQDARSDGGELRRQCTWTWNTCF